MAPHPEPGVFLERTSYRRRRLVDGLKVLPLLGAWMFMMPLLWSVDNTTMSGALVYIFIVWATLILSAAVLLVWLTRLRRASATHTPQDVL
ncbi:MAG: hypothetical protein AB8B71_14690 [Paracoccaceae bacterium]